MKVPFVDLTRESHKISKAILDKIKKVISSGTFILGNEVTQFEEMFSKYLGIKYCVGVASGTDALTLSLKALGIGKGDEIIVPAFTFIASVSPIVLLGAKPVLVDILPDKPTINYSQVENAITERTKAILPVHLYGYSCDMQNINKMAKKHNLFVIEDACQAHGSKYKNKKAGTFGDIAAFSFYPGKNLGSYGDAGAIVTSNKLLAEKVRMLRDHGQKKKYRHEVIGYNSRLDTINAAVLKIKLPYLEEWNKKRRQLANLYSKLLRNLPIELPFENNVAIPNYHLYVIKTSKRDKLYTYLRNKNIFCGIHYPFPLHLQPALKSLNYKAGDFPSSEKFARTCLSLPMFPHLSEKEVYFVAKQISAFFGL